VASKAFRKSAGRLDFQRAQVVSQVPLMVEPIGIQGSHILQGLAVADVLVVIEKDRGNVEAGETVQVMAL
jgi:molybdopterin molybdotransferase